MTHASDGLARRLSTADAVVLGLGAMLGAGVFAVPGPAAAVAGPWLLVGLVIALTVAGANATSSAQLAARYPESGGTYVYARYRLGDVWGFLAGWSFVVGKTASLAAMALTLGTYLHPPLARPLGLAAVALLSAVNYRGVEKTVRLTRALVAVVLAVLAFVVAAAVTSTSGTVAHLREPAGNGVLGVLRSAGLLFFAFAGYARLATLGEEVRDPERSIPRAIPLALGAVAVVYAVVFAAALFAVGARTLADAEAPLAAVVTAGRWQAGAPVVRAGAAVAAAGVLLSLLAGVSRTVLAMARRRELPAVLDAVHPRHRTPHRAETATAAAVGVVVLVADVRGAIGFSSFAVLAYYTLANASAWTLPPAERRWPRSWSAFGVVGCAALAFALPRASVIGGVVLLALGAVAWRVSRGAAGGKARAAP